MHSIAGLFVVAVLCVLAEGRSVRNIDPFVPGEHPVNNTLILNAITIATDTNIDVFAPNTPGDFPVFYFVTGLAGNA